MNVLLRSTTTIPASVKSSVLLTYTDPWTVELWRNQAYTSWALLEPYELLEIRLFKNRFNVEHEFLIGKFKSPEEVIFISVERSARYSHLDHEPSAEEVAKAMTQTKGKDESKGIFSNRSSISSSNSLSGASPADDMIMVIRGPTTFESAVEKFMTKKISRYSRSSYLERGAMKFSSTESNVAPSSSTTYTRATVPGPNLMHFSYAAIAAHRTRLYYTPTGQNCYWFANAILFILKEKFEPSEPFIVHSAAGTWSFGLLRISLGSLQEKDFERLVREYNTCVVEQGAASKTKTSEQVKEDEEREVEREQFALQILDAETKAAEADAKAKEADAKAKEADAKAKEADAKAKEADARAKEADVRAKEAAARAKEKDKELETERAKFEKVQAEYEAKIKALELSSANVT